MRYQIYLYSLRVVWPNKTLYGPLVYHRTEQMSRQHLFHPLKYGWAPTIVDRKDICFPRMILWCSFFPAKRFLTRESKGMWQHGVPQNWMNLRSSVAPSANHSNLWTLDLLNIPLSRLNIERENDLAACTIRSGRGEFLTSYSICSFSRILSLHLCSMSSHSWAARFSFLRQCNKDPSVICHFSDVWRAASILMCAISSFCWKLIPLSSHIFEQDQIGFG